MNVKFRWMQFTTMDYKQFQLDFFFFRELCWFGWGFFLSSFKCQYIKHWSKTN